MKIAVIGGGGAMARTTIRDLSECPDVAEILVADGEARWDWRCLNSMM
ncbi:hypothetical protein ES703_37364 [subsurface metagenome]